MDKLKSLAKKALPVALLSAFALAGCVAVPAYDPYYGGGYAASPVMVQPYYYGHYGRGYYRGDRYWRH